MKRGREYNGREEAYNVEKRERRSNIIFPLILRLLGRLSSVERGGRGRTFLGRLSRFKINGGGEEYQVVGNFIHPGTKVMGKVLVGKYLIDLSTNVSIPIDDETVEYRLETIILFLQLKSSSHPVYVKKLKQQFPDRTIVPMDHR